MLTPEERELLSKLGRKTIVLRRKTKGECLVCRRPFEGYVGKLYCSHACAQKAYYRRHHDEVLKRKREARRRKRGQAGQGEGP